MRINLNKRFIDSLPKIADDKVFWDEKVRGFGVRIQGNSKQYIVYYRNGNQKQKKMTIGAVGIITPDEARAEAIKILAEVKKGSDPAEQKKLNKKEMTMENLCKWYLSDGVDNKKETTLKSDIGRINNHIIPLLGSEKVKLIRRCDIEKFMHDVSHGNNIKKSENKHHGHIATGGKGVARRTIGLLGAIFEFAISRGLIEFNPVHGIKKAPDVKRQKFLDLDGVSNLGKILKREEILALSEKGINIIKLLLLTGCRRNEIASLRWEEIDFKNQCFNFKDTKTGAQKRFFGEAALRLLRNLNKGEKFGWVFPSPQTKGYFRNANRIFDIIRKVKDENGNYIIDSELRIHDLRHTHACTGNELGIPDTSISKTIGHKLNDIHSRYTHPTDRNAIITANRISQKIEEALNNTYDSHKKENF